MSNGLQEREVQLAEIQQRQLSEREERLARMAARNISQKDIAASENVSEGLVSQILNTEHVRSRIASIKAKNLASNIVYDEKLNGIQNQVLHKLGGLVNTIETARDAAAVLTSMDKLTRRLDPSEGKNHNGQTNIVNITIPNAAMLTGLVQNEKKQAIEIGGLPLINAGSTNLMEKVHEFKQLESARSNAEEVPTTGQRFSPEDL